MQSPQIIYENADFAVINKPAGVLVHHTHFWLKGQKRYSKEFTESLADWVEEKYPETIKVGDHPATRPGMVHRLDKDTSGVIIICRTQSAYDYFKDLFKNRKIKKIYLALVWGEVIPPEGVIDKPIGILPETVKRSVSSASMTMMKDAVTEYKVIKYIKDENDKIKFSLLEVNPKTGRTHQIRIHLKSIGHPIVGDKLYGSAPIPELKRHFLHAASLEFVSPNGEKMKIEAPLPEDLKLLI